MEQRIQTEIAEKEGLLVDLEQPIDLKLNPLTHHKEVLVSAYQYGLRYKDADKMLFENQTFEIRNGDRLFISGKNGSGKTSLIKAILGETENLLEQGDLRIASGIEISYINQDTSYLRGTVHSFCTEHQLEESLLCSILRQLGYWTGTVCQKSGRIFRRTEEKGGDCSQPFETGAFVYLG